MADPKKDDARHPAAKGPDPKAAGKADPAETRVFDMTDPRQAKAAAEAANTDEGAVIVSPASNIATAGGPPPVSPEQPLRAESLPGPEPHDGPPDTDPVEPAEPVEWAADLVRELGKTGTGQGKLAKVRQAMLDRHNDPAHAKLKEDDPRRHLTAKEALEVLEADDAVPEATRAKARAIVGTGRWEDAPAVHPADQLPAPRGSKKVAGKKADAKDAGKGPGRGKG